VACTVLRGDRRSNAAVLPDTGYNAALLCHRLGPASVVSLDIDPALVAAAKDHLGSLGYHPTVLVGDGTAGAAEHGPYERIIATAAVADIPLVWIEQLAPGGKILANVRGELAGGTLCLLTKDSHDEVIGPVLPLGGHFMWLRPDVDSPLRTPAPEQVRSFRDSARTSTALDPAPLIEDDSFRFLLQLHLRGVRGFRHTNAYDPRTRTTRPGFAVETADGSHAEVIAEPDSDQPIPGDPGRPAPTVGQRRGRPPTLAAPRPTRPQPLRRRRQPHH
jgi:protein-L-isoaspartate O-methyltransferase